MSGCVVVAILGIFTRIKKMFHQIFVFVIFFFLIVAVIIVVVKISGILEILLNLIVQYRSAPFFKQICLIFLILLLSTVIQT